MSKSKLRSNKTEAFAKSCLRRAGLGRLLILGVLAIAAKGGVAQQTQPIQPCTVKQPCASEPTSPSRQNSPSQRPSARKRTRASKPASAIKPASTAPARVEARASETLVDANIPADPAVEKMLEPYSAKVRALEVVIGRLEGELNKAPVGAGTLGHFVADGIRAHSSARLGRPVLLAVTNNGGLRKNTISPGELRAADIFELLPFENALIEIDLTGAQLLKLLSVVTTGRDAQSGARIKYRLNAENRPELVSGVLVDKDGGEIPIDPKATYPIVTIDYLLKLASGSYSILQEGKNVKPLGVTIRDAIMDYVKAESAAGRPIKARLDDRFTLVNPDESKPESNRE